MILNGISSIVTKWY